KAEKESKPSEEFLEGEKPFEYNFKFHTGEEFNARQSNRGGGIITIERNGETIFDFKNILPEGYKFVTPTYFKKHPDERYLLDYVDTDWRESPKRKLIFLGEFKSPQDVLLILHEIGHAFTETEEEFKIREQIEEGIHKASEDRDIILETLMSEEGAKMASKAERNAWAWSLRTMRKIQQEIKADLKSLFPKFSDLKRHINDYLATHRRSYEYIIAQGYDEDFYKELQKFFDRWQYGPK
ncbi:MAG: hypothetical protein AAB958_00615, partial [Patescibacteria group bacterium]